MSETKEIQLEMLRAMDCVESITSNEELKRLHDAEENAIQADRIYSKLLEVVHEKLDASMKEDPRGVAHAVLHLVMTNGMERAREIVLNICRDVS